MSPCLVVAMAKRCGFFTWPFNANVEGRISSMYKAVAKQQLRVGAEIAELLDFGQLWGSLDHEAITHHVDYDFARSPDRLEDRQPQQSTPSNSGFPR